MSRVHRSRMAAVLAIGLLVAACGGSDEPTSTSISPTPASTADTAAVTTTAGSATPPRTQVPSTSATSAPSSIRDLRGDLGIGSIVLQPAEEGGPHPTLAWDPVNGAASYWLVLHDGDGRVYWAWTGAETQVRVGGGDRPELNQTAALHEPMTWSVTAVDVSGGLLAFSDVATVSP